jgi:hypothetical protein
MSKHWLLGILVLAAIGMVGVGFFSSTTADEVQPVLRDDADDTQQPPPARVDFPGKVVVVTFGTRPPEMVVAALENAQVRQLGGGHYLVGRGAGASGLKGATVWFPLSNASLIAEFDNLQEARQHFHIPE